MKSKPRRFFAILLTAVNIVFLAGNAYLLTQNARLRTEQLLSRKAAYGALLRDENLWLRSCQLPDGAIAFRPAGGDGRAIINPYYACYTAKALCLSPTEENLDAVRRYLDWHFAHLNVEPDYNGLSGTIYEYDAALSGDTVTLTTENHYDSADSYAALFLTALTAYYQASGDSRYVLGHYEEIALVSRLLPELTDGGLTLAKPDYPVKYLMDNCEVAEGLRNAILLYEEVFMPSLSGVEYEYSALVRCHDGVISQMEALLWNRSEARYESSLQGESSYASFDWAKLYPDASCQVFPIVTGVLEPDGSRAQTIYEAFCRAHDWENLSYYTGGEASFYWGCFVYAAACMEDWERVETYLDWYIKNVSFDHAYPCYNADSAWVLRAAQLLSAHYDAQLDMLDPFFRYHDRGP